MKDQKFKNRFYKQKNFFSGYILSLFKLPSYVSGQVTTEINIKKKELLWLL